MDAIELRQIIKESIKPLHLWSLAAENLLVGTAAHESGGFKYRVQIGGGPAISLYQIEARTYYDTWNNFLKYRKNLSKKIIDKFGDKNYPGIYPLHFLLQHNDYYSSCIARIIYLREREPLPQADDVIGLAQYWKTHYNTKLGKGKIEDFVQNWEEYVA